MDFKHKLGYMFIGCLFTILGYIFALLVGGDTTHAQQDEQVLDKIVCKRLEVVNKEGEPVGVIVADENTGGIVIGTHPTTGVGIDGGFLFVRNILRQEVAVVMAATEDGGSIGVYNAEEQEVVNINATEDGGLIVFRNAAGEDTVGMGANKDGDGVIKSYKGGWRTH